MTTQRGYSGDSETAFFAISVAAELAGMHPQTLRQYDRLGLVSPQRAKGRGRRYTKRDVHKLREIQRLSQEEGVNLAGVEHIMRLTDQISSLQEQILELHALLQEATPSPHRVFTADSSGHIKARNPGAAGQPSPQQSRQAVMAAQLQQQTHWFNRLPPAIARLVLASLVEGQSYTRGQLPTRSAPLQLPQSR